MTLEELGWNAYWQAVFAPFGERGARPARIVAQSGLCRVADGHGEAWAEVAGRLRHEADAASELPVVGDWVALRGAADGQALIDAVLPRKSRFSRQAAGSRTGEQVVAANVDTALLVSGLDGDFNPRRIERYLTAAWDSGARPVVVLNKADCTEEAEERRAAVEAVAIGVPVHLVSARTGDGVAELESYLRRGETVTLLGSSGVGKSTLVNRLLARPAQRTSEVRDSDSRGRHTTTHREIFAAPGGGLLLDTPGLRELQLWAGDDALPTVFADVDALAPLCRYGDCTHESEPGCAVLAAVAAGTLAPERLDSYRKLAAELRHLHRRQDAQAQQKEKQRIKVLMRSINREKR